MQAFRIQAGSFPPAGGAASAPRTKAGPGPGVGPQGIGPKPRCATDRAQMWTRGGRSSRLHLGRRADGGLRPRDGRAARSRPSGRRGPRDRRTGGIPRPPCGRRAMDRRTGRIQDRPADGGPRTPPHGGICRHRPRTASPPRTAPCASTVCVPGRVLTSAGMGGEGRAAEPVITLGIDRTGVELPRQPGAPFPSRPAASNLD
jgi:hypothetical protein